MMIISIILLVLGVYLAIGFFFAIPFVLRGVKKIDEAAQGGNIGFRIIIIPGTMVFWPFLLKKWLDAGKTKNND